MSHEKIFPPALEGAEGRDNPRVNADVFFGARAARWSGAAIVCEGLISQVHYELKRARAKTSASVGALGGPHPSPDLKRFCNNRLNCQDGCVAHLYFAFWASDMPRHFAPSALPTSPKDMLGLALTILGRSSLQKIM